MVAEVSTQPYVEDTWTELVALVDRTTELLTTTLLGAGHAGSDIRGGHRSRAGPCVPGTGGEPPGHGGGLSRGARSRARRAATWPRPGEVTDLLLGPVYYRVFLSGSP
jgi:hypothetical protein